MCSLQHLCSVSPSLNLFPFPILLFPFPSPFPISSFPLSHPFSTSLPPHFVSLILPFIFSLTPFQLFPFPFSLLPFPLLPFPLPCPPLLFPRFFHLYLTDKFEPYPERDCNFFFRISKKYMMKIMTELYMNTGAKTTA